MKLFRWIFFLLWLFLLSGSVSYAQNKLRSPAEIKKEMAEIRRTTDWKNDAEAEKAQAKIELLSKELIISGKTQKQLASGVQPDSVKLREDAEYKMAMWHQMMLGKGMGEHSEILLAKPLREEIVEAYKNDESPKVKNPGYFEEQTFLCIDMSVPTIQRIIDQMENFKSIKSLMITCSKEIKHVDLEDILSRAANYPLEQLHIINFRQEVSSLPESIGQFKGLTILSLYNNDIQDLPVSIGQLSSLKIMYLDINPISIILPVVASLKSLETLGVAKTNISETEINEIQTTLPGCKILVQ